MNRVYLYYKEVVKYVQETLILGRKTGCNRSIVLASGQEGKANIQKRTIIENLKRIYGFTKINT